MPSLVTMPLSVLKGTPRRYLSESSVSWQPSLRTRSLYMPLRGVLGCAGPRGGRHGYGPAALQDGRALAAGLAAVGP